MTLYILKELQEYEEGMLHCVYIGVVESEQYAKDWSNADDYRYYVATELIKEDS